MELRARIRPKLRQIALPAALIALAVPASAGAAPVDAHAAKAKVKLPVITSISPKTVAITQTLTIRGRNFLRGRNKNTVVFKRTGAKAVFVKADVGTTKLLRVVVPTRLTALLLLRDGVPTGTRFALRVLTKKLGKRFTKTKLSPIVSPEPPPATAPPAAAPDGDCDGDRTRNGVDPDDDNDLLADTEELRLKTDQCRPDTDGDGVSDGYEYQSAVDLNDDEYRGPQNIVPAPYKLPYPNPLFPDADVDYDGDSLRLGEEFSLWKSFRDVNAGLNDLVYSDGNQYSAYGRNAQGNRPGPVIGPYAPEKKYQDFLASLPGQGYGSVKLVGSLWPSHPTVPLWDSNHDGVPTAAGFTDPSDLNPSLTAPNTFYLYSETSYWDLDGDGRLSDDERDEDADGLSNYDESHGRMIPGFWIGCYDKEGPYPIAYAGTSITDADTDGDGIPDGADDQDHDDIPNVQELSRNAASGRIPSAQSCDEAGAPEDSNTPQGWVNPFNPCLPDPRSRTCERHPGLSGKYAPFDPEVPNYQVLN